MKKTTWSFFKGSKPLFLLINETFWKGIFGPFFAFGFPLIFIAILGSLLGYDQVLGGILGISASAISLTSMPTSIFEFKRSSLLKRIGATPIRPSLFIFITSAYYFAIILISIIWCIIFSLLIFGIPYWNIGKTINEASPLTNNLTQISLNFFDTLSIVNWGTFIWGQLMSIAVGISLGMVLVSFAKSSVMIQAVGVTILITSQFLSSQVLPPSLIRNVDALWYIGYASSPFKASTNIILESWNGQIASETQIFVLSGDNLIPNLMQSNSFDFSSEYMFYDSRGRVLQVFLRGEKITNLILPFVWIGLFSVIAVKNFKWSAR